MNKLHTTVLCTCLLASAGAIAQSASERAEMFRQNTDQMIPPAIAAGAFDRGTPQPVYRQSEDQRRADAFITSTDMMLPPAIAANVGTMAAAPSARSANVSRMDADDRRTAEFQRRTERMKPN